jgi:drug/metabolite transporter (DMT)-like permease
MGVLLGLTAAVFWGSADFLARGAARATGAYRTMFYMQWIGFAALGAYLLLSGELARLIATVTPDVWVWGIIAGFLNLVAQLLLYRAFEVCYAMSVVSSIAASYAAITVVLAVLSGEHLSGLRAVGILMALPSVVLAAADLRGAGQSARPPGGKFLEGGVGLAMAASVCFGLDFWIMGFRVTPYLGAVTPVWVARSTAIVLLVGIGALFRQNIRPPERGVWGVILLVGALDTAAFVAHTLGVTTEQVSVMTVLSGLFSAVTVMLSWLFLHERLAMSQWLGIALIFISIVLVSI